MGNGFWRIAYRFALRLARFPFSADPPQTASFSSFAGRNATFLLAAICIISPVAGLRAVAPLQVLRHRLDHSGEQVLGLLLGYVLTFRDLLEDALQHDRRRRRPVFRGSLIFRTRCHYATRFDC